MPVRPERVWQGLSDGLRTEIVQDLAAILAEVIHEIGAHYRPASRPVRGHLCSPVQPAPGADEPGEPAAAIRSAPARSRPWLNLNTAFQKRLLGQPLTRARVVVSITRMVRCGLCGTVRQRSRRARWAGARCGRP